MKRILVSLLLVMLCTLCHSQNIAPFILINPSGLVGSASEPVNGFSVSVKDNFKAFLRWKAGTSKEGDSFFAIEKSFNGMDFAVIGVIKNPGGEWVEFLDESIEKGRIYYRVKRTALNSPAPVYSTVLSVTLSGDSFCKFYPNPVDKVLIIRSDVAVEIQISDRFGKPVISSRLEAGLKLLDVSSLEAGVYLITLFQKDSNRFVTEKLVKK